MHLFKLSESTAARRRLLLRCVDATDGVTAETGLTFAAGELKVSKNGGAEANHAGTVTEIAGGMYHYEFAAAELDTIGTLYVRVEKTGVHPFVGVAQVVAYDPNDAAALGISRLDAAVSSRSSHSAADVRAEMDSNSVDLNTIIGGLVAVEADTQDIQGRLPAALVAGRIAANAEVVGDKTGYALAVAPPTAVEIRQEMDANSVDLAAIEADTQDVQARLPATLVGGRMAANAEVVGDKTGYALTAGERDAIAAALLNLADGIEAGFTIKRAIRIIAAAVAGKTAGGPSGFTARDLTDARDQVVGTADANGNRTPSSYGA